MKRNTSRLNHSTNHSTAMVRSATCLALISVSVAQGAGDKATERQVTFKTSDGWQITGFMQIPASEVKVPGVILVHGSRHESDAYGQVSTPGLPQTLSQHGVATLRIDIRGRGASREPRAFYAMAPEQREAVRLDIEAAINFLASQSGVDATHIGIIAEQDSASAAILASAKDRRVVAYILISGRLSQSAKELIKSSRAALLCLISKEDRRGFKDMNDAYLSSKSDHSRLRVFEGLALGTTMFSTWRNEFPQERPIEEEAGIWLAEMLKTRITSGNARRRRG